MDLASCLNTIYGLGQILILVQKSRILKIAFETLNKLVFFLESLCEVFCFNYLNIPIIPITFLLKI